MNSSSQMEDTTVNKLRQFYNARSTTNSMGQSALTFEVPASSTSVILTPLSSIFDKPIFFLLYNRSR